ncbi:MAG: hypothetical protein WCD53_05810 [Microcoleus sp.]
MASKKSQKSTRNKVKQDGIQLKILEPQITAVLPISKDQPSLSVPVQLSVSVTNNTQTSIPFIIYGRLIPEIIGPDGQTLHRKEPINRQVQMEEYEGVLVGVREQIGICLEARLSWQDNLLLLRVPTNPSYWHIPINPDNSWSFEGLELGTYQLRFIYDNPTGNVLCFDLETRQRTLKIEGIKTGQLATPFVNLRILQTVQLNNSVIEVDGISFEILMPERELVVPEKLSDGCELLDLGIRITNNTTAPLRFRFHDAITPELMLPNGQIMRESSQWSDWLIGYEESDFPLAMPGEDVIFSPGGSIQKIEDNQFELIIWVGNGGSWRFNRLQLGNYQIRLEYSNDAVKVKVYGEDGKKKVIDNILTGQVFTSFIEFSLVDQFR